MKVHATPIKMCSQTLAVLKEFLVASQRRCHTLSGTPIKMCSQTLAVLKEFLVAGQRRCHTLSGTSMKHSIYITKNLRVNWTECKSNKSLHPYE